MWTDAEAKQFYNSAAWKKKREQILIRDHYECADCRKRIMTTPRGELVGWQKRMHRARHVHHVQELKEHPELALADDNLISLCVMCHNIRHGRDAFAWKVPEKEVKIDERW